jgi:hypothetical protein
MTTLDFTPDIVPLKGLAGDTLSFTVKVPTAFIAGREWSAQVRSVPGSPGVDATFNITPPTVTDGHATLTLSSADTARLATLGGTQAVRIGGSGKAVVYTGVWDCQLAPAGGGDPTTTLVRGPISIDGDVTRPLP